MAAEPGSTDQLSQVISHAVAPAFLPGAMAAFVSMLSGMIEAVLGRIRGLNAIPANDLDRAHLKKDIPRLSRRLKRQRRALLLTVAAGFVTTILMISSFALAILGIQHVWIVAVPFIVALALLCAAVIMIGLDGLISVHSHDQF